MSGGGRGAYLWAQDVPKHSINLALSLLMLKSGSVNVLYDATSRSSRQSDILSLIQFSRKKWCNDSFAKLTHAWPGGSW